MSGHDTDSAYRAPGPAAPEATEPRAGMAARRRLGSATWLAALLVGVLALAPRLAGLADFYTIDEGYHWPGRVERFSHALVTGDWLATDQTGHPGVTTMALGSIGRALAFRLGIPDPGWAGGGAGYLGMLRAPLALTNALAAIIGYLLLRRLLRPAEALAAGLMWASAPFLVAHGRLLHLDALLTSFVSLSLLLLLAGLWRREPGAGSQGSEAINAQQNSDIRSHHSRAASHKLSPTLPFLIGSGVCAGLAVLTKAPSLILLPFAGMLMLVAALASGAPRARAWASTIRDYLIWLGCAALVALALWPAMWVSPAAAVGDVVREIIENGGQPHDAGNFFLGRTTADPGPLFYLAVVLLRTTPLMLIGLICLAALACRSIARHRGRPALTPAAWALLSFALFFALVMTVEAKKLDRYLLPIWPALCALAAIGVVRAAERAVSLIAGRGRPAGRAGWIACAAVGIEGAALCAGYHPYTLAFYNPLLGGGAAAERVMLVGIGEGMDQAGAWLRGRPDLYRGDVLSWIPPSLAPFVPREVLVRDLRPAFLGEPSSYAVLYVRSVQNQESPEAEAAVRQMPALFRVRLHGIEYASIHQLPRPFTTPAGAIFGEGIHLRGFSQSLGDGALVITPSWDIQADQPGGAFVFVHVLDSAGQRVAQVDAPLDQGMFAQWQAGQQFDGALPIALPADLAPGEYRLALGVYQLGGSRLALAQGRALPEPVDGPHVVDLGVVRLPG